MAYGEVFPKARRAVPLIDEERWPGPTFIPDGLWTFDGQYVLDWTTCIRMEFNCNEDWGEILLIQGQNLWILEHKPIGIVLRQEHVNGKVSLFYQPF